MYKFQTEDSTEPRSGITS